MNLSDFENNLREILKKYSKPRPLICEGNPLECEIFIVGINSATEMNTSFWNFWSKSSGFKKTEWLESYILERTTETLKTK